MKRIPRRLRCAVKYGVHRVKRRIGLICTSSDPNLHSNGIVKKISLITGYDDKIQLADIAEKLEEFKQSLLELMSN